MWYLSSLFCIRDTAFWRSPLREALASRRACMAVSELLKSAPFCALIILKLRTFTTFFVLLMSGNNPESELYICLKSIRDKFVYRAAKRRNPNFVCNHPMCRQMSLKTPKRKLNTSCENLYDPSSSPQWPVIQQMSLTQTDNSHEDGCLRCHQTWP